MTVIKNISWIGFLISVASADGDHWIASLLLAGAFLIVATVTGNMILSELDEDIEEEGGEESWEG